MKTQKSLAFLENFQKLKTRSRVDFMGVLNITPDSFSDGGQFTSSESLWSSLLEMKVYSEIVDIGAQSTAPFNEEIDSYQELGRFEKLLYPILETYPDPKITISIDTYRPNTFYTLYRKIKKHWKDSELIFNDISGQVDSELLSLLKEDLAFEYVLCHNLVPSRDCATKHMEFLTEDILQSVDNFFLTHSNLNKLRAVHCDPCFGFSKTYEQNHLLFNSLLTSHFYEKYQSLIIGISKKSFLRFPKELRLKDHEDLIEQVQACFLMKALECYHPLTIRAHDPSPLMAALSAKALLV